MYILYIYTIIYPSISWVNIHVNATSFYAETTRLKLIKILGFWKLLFLPKCVHRLGIDVLPKLFPIIWLCLV